MQDVQADISDQFIRIIEGKIAAARRPITPMRKLNVAKIPNLDGHPSPERARTIGELSLPEHRNISRCTVVPIVKPIGYAVKTRQNVLDKSLTTPQLHVLAALVYGKMMSKKEAGTLDYTAVSGGGYTSKSLISDDQKALSDWVKFIESELAPEIVDNINRLTSGCIGELGLTEKKLGKLISGKKCERRQLGVFEGYFKAVSQQILENDKKYLTWNGAGGVYLLKKLMAKQLI